MTGWTLILYIYAGLGSGCCGKVIGKRKLKGLALCMY